MVVRKPTYKKWWLDFQGRLLGGHHYLQVTKFHSQSRSIMIRFQGFRLCLCSRSWDSHVFSVQTQQTHEYKIYIFQGIQQVKHNTPLLPVLLPPSFFEKKQESNQRPNFGSHLGNLLSFKLIIRLKSLESRLDGFKRKKPFKTTSGTWALGPSSWPRGAYLGWPCIGSEPIWRVFRV